MLSSTRPAHLRGALQRSLLPPSTPGLVAPSPPAPGPRTTTRDVPVPRGAPAPLQASIQIHPGLGAFITKPTSSHADYGLVLAVVALSSMLLGLAKQEALERHDTFFAMMLLLGSIHPWYAAVLGLFWIGGHALWVAGVGTGNVPRQSPAGIIVWVAQVLLVVSTFLVGLRRAGFVSF